MDRGKRDCRKVLALSTALVVAFSFPGMAGSAQSGNARSSGQVNAISQSEKQQGAQAHPQLTAMVVPSPFGLVCGPRIEQLLANHFLGDLRELVVIGADDQFHDYSRPLHWRQDVEKSGVNVLTLGILHETALRWTPPPVRVVAQTHTFEPSRPNPHGSGQSTVTVPDSVQNAATARN